MFKRFRAGLFFCSTTLVLSLLGLSGCDSKEPPVKLSASLTPQEHVELSLTSQIDSLQVDEILIIGGDCTEVVMNDQEFWLSGAMPLERYAAEGYDPDVVAYYSDRIDDVKNQGSTRRISVNPVDIILVHQLPMLLSQGQKVEAFLPCGQLQEVTVKTDQGDFKFAFNLGESSSVESAQPNTEVQTTVDTQQIEGAEQANHTPPVQASSRIAQIVTPEMLGADRAYLEQFTGVARQSDAYINRRIYPVDGCDLEVYFGGESVRAFALKVSEHCTFDLTPFIQGETPVFAHQLTFGKFDQSMGTTSYYADCLGLCGNAYDPAVHSHFSGPRALGFLELMVSSTQPHEGMSEWEQMMQAQQGDEWVLEQRYNCESQSFTNEAKKLFAREPIERIEIGYDLLDRHALGRDCKALAESDAQIAAQEAAELDAMFRTYHVVIGYLRVNASDGYANLRSGPGTQHPVRFELSNESVLDLIRQEGNWYYIALPDNPLEQGYVHQSQVVLVN